MFTNHLFPPFLQRLRELGVPHDLVELRATSVEAFTKEEEGFIVVASVSSKSKRIYGGEKEEGDREHILIRGRNWGLPEGQAGP